MTNLDMTMVRGDTMAFNLKLSDVDVDTVTSIYYTVKKKATDRDPVFQKSLEDGVTYTGEKNTYRVRVAPADTEDVKPGRYDYDLQIGIGEDIYTEVMGKLTIIQDVTEESV